MTSLSLSLLGSFQVVVNGEPVTGFRSNKVRALLAYLTMEAPRPFSRDKLAGFLWPNLPDRAARTNLRTTLYDLRQNIADRKGDPPYLCMRGGAIQFNIASNYWLDAAAFETAITAGRANPRELEPWQQAIDLYQGPFLEGFSLSDCLAFEEWVLVKRELFSREMVHALQQLGANLERHGQFDKAEIALRHLLQLEPLHEAVHRQLMRLLYTSGRRTAALKQYERCHQILDDVLGVNPSTKTGQLYEQIKDGESGRRQGAKGYKSGMMSMVSQSWPVLYPRPTTTFVGFEVELAYLNRCLSYTLARNGQVVFITGEAGSGKSTLLSEFARWAMRVHPELLVVTGRCDAHAGPGIPYLPLREVFQQLLGQKGIGPSDDTGDYESTRRLQANLSVVIPILVKHGPSLLTAFLPGEELIRLVRETAGLDPAVKARLKLLVSRQSTAGNNTPGLKTPLLFERVMAVLSALSEHYPLIIILDDLQWADRGTINLLYHLGRRLTDNRILVTGAYRPGVVAAGPPAHLAAHMDRHPLRPVVFELQRRFEDNRLDLDASDGRAFVDAFLDREPNRLDGAFRQALHRHTNGNPLFVVELLRLIEKRGQLIRDEQGRLAAGEEVEWDRLPPRVESAIGERIDQLPSAVRLALEVASVQGEEFIIEVVEKILPLDRSSTDWASKIASRQHRLVQAQSIQRLGDLQLSHYQFRHFLIQQYLYQRLDNIQRTRLHEATGRALEALFGERAKEHAGRLSWHFEMAGVWDKAVQYLLFAGKRAYMLSANEEAIDFFRRGIKLLADRPPGRERDQRELTLQLALTAPLLARKGYTAPEIQKAANRAIYLAERLDDLASLFPARLLLFTHHSMRAEYRPAMEMGELLLIQADGEQNSLHLTQAHHVLGHVNFCLGLYQTAHHHFDLALASFDAQVESLLLTGFIGGNIRITTLIRKAWTLWFLGYPDQSQAVLEETMSLIEQVGRDHDLALALGLGICPILYIRRDCEQAETQAQRLLDLAAAKGLHYFVPFGQVFLGSGMIKRGLKVEGLNELYAGLNRYRQDDQRALLTFCLSILVESLGADDEAGQVLDDALAFVEESGERFYEAELNRLRGEYLLLRDADPSEVEACFLRALDIAKRQQSKSLELRAAMSLARLRQLQGRTEPAHILLAEVYDWFTEGFGTVDLQEARGLIEEFNRGQQLERSRTRAI